MILTHILLYEDIDPLDVFEVVQITHCPRKPVQNIRLALYISGLVCVNLDNSLRKLADFFRLFLFFL